MNKLFTKIGTAMVGIAMAIGVGVAVGRDGFEKAEAASFELIFKVNSGDGTSLSTTDNASSVFSSGEEYVTGTLVTATKAYNAGSSGLKLGTSSVAGTIKMTLASAITPTSVVVNAKQYNGAATLKFNGSATKSVSSSFSDITFDGGEEITYIELVSSKYIWVKSITINYGSSGGTPVKEGKIKFGSAAGSLNVDADSVNGKDSQENTWYVTTEGTTSFTPNASYAQIGSSSKPATKVTFSMTLENNMKFTQVTAKFGGNSGTAGSIEVKLGGVTKASGSFNATADVTVSQNNLTVETNTMTVVVGDTTNIAKGIKVYEISYKYKITDAQAISDFSTSFKTNLADACANENANNKSALIAEQESGLTLWEEQKAEFEALDSGAKVLFVETEDDPTDITSAVKLYKHIVTKYGLATWDDAPSTQAGVNVAYANTSNQNIVLIIVIISSVMLLTVVGCAVLHRRKEQQ